jgi:outer membrane protein
MMKRAAASCAVLLVLLSGGVSGQAVRTDSVDLSLSDAVTRALSQSEEVRGALEQVRIASAQVKSARASMLPTVNTQVGYTKTLRSVFQNAGFEIPDSLKFEPDSLASIAERLRYLEQKTPNAAFGALGGLFGNLPFGRENAWTAAATFSQPVYTGGRASSQVEFANHAADAADASYTEARADIMLQVREAYLSALFAADAERIIELSVALTEQHLSRVRLLLENGQASELDVLRSDVELSNLRPLLVQARNARQLSLLNLKRLVNLPIDAPLRLTTALTSAGADFPSPENVRLPTLAEAAPLLARRSAVRAAEQQVLMREEQVDIARASFFPSLNLTGNFARQAFPSGILPSDWQDDWNVGFAVQWSAFNGFRRNAEVDVARSQVRQAELQADQLRESVRLQYEQALGELDRARAQITATTRTVGQAERVHELTELRFAEGLATQLDVSDARLALQQARSNQANAYHDFYLALARAERALGTGFDNAR